MGQWMLVGWGRALACVVVMAWGLCLPSAAWGVVRDVAPGDVPVLKGDDALLLISVDTDVPLEFVRISRTGIGMFDNRTLHAVSKGVSARLYVVPAGRYRWSTVGYVGEYRLSKDPEFEFDVKPGVLNYPGDLVFRRQSWSHAIVHVANRGLQAMDWMERTHPSVGANARFHFTGRYQDPFPDYYRQRAKPLAALPALPAVPKVQSMAREIEALWQPGRVHRIELNPAGDLIAEVAVYRAMRTRDKPDAPAAGEAAAPEPADPRHPNLLATGKWTWGINLIDLKANTAVRLFEAPTPVTRLDWVGDRILVMSFGHEDFPDSVVAATIADGPSGRTYSTALVPRLGTVIGPDPLRPGHVLFASTHLGEVRVHALDVRSQQALSDFDFRRSQRLNDGFEDAERFFVDGRGTIRLAVVRRGQSRVLRYGIPGAIRDVMTLDGETDFEPMALSGDGTRAWGLAEEGRGQRELVEWDPDRGVITRTVFRIPGRDVLGPVVSPDGRLLGAAYLRDGLIVTEYFGADDEALYRRLARAFPGKSVFITQRNADRTRMILSVAASDQPLQFYFFDAKTAQASLVSENAPWLSGRTFAAAQALKVPTADGHQIDAFVTLPPGARGKVPLVVMPHGGPVGITDTRYFDPEVQFLAAQGYAVLQVNFRGSDGYGTAFREAGHRNLGQGIEDDIDAAVAEALARHPLDATRMCVLGASHGGYSAMIATVRHPTRYRCAVSLSGVSDLPLLFTASDGARFEEGRRELTEVFGDPATEMQRLMDTSPLYRHDAMTTPLMLVHGTEDFRVDYEHARRIERLLALAGRPPVTLTLVGEGHGIDDAEQRVRAWNAIAAFLRQHLDGPAPAATAPAAAPSGGAGR